MMTGPILDPLVGRNYFNMRLSAQTEQAILDWVSLEGQPLSEQMLSIHLTALRMAIVGPGVAPCASESTQLPAVIKEMITCRSEEKKHMASRCPHIGEDAPR